MRVSVRARVGKPGIDCGDLKTKLGLVVLFRQYYGDLEINYISGT